ncbi:hypothetical protein PAMP_021860 [Pampus punctatissimus]
MEEEETASILSRKEQRRQKLMEYLAAKGKMKASNPKLHPRDDCQVKNPVTSGLKVVRGKENNAPFNSLRNETKEIQSVAPQARHPARRTFGVIGIPAAKKANHSSATSGLAQPKSNKNTVLTNTCSMSSKSNLINLKNQSKAGMQSSVKASSTATCTAVAKPNSRFSSCSNATCSAPMKTVSVRISLGPIVKTKTGLVPAVIQPRNTKLDLICTSVTATDTSSVANRERSNTSSVSFPAKGITFPHTALSNRIHKKTTVSRNAGAVTKTQDQKRFNTQTLLDKHSQPSGKIQSLSGLKAMCRATLVKPVEKGGKPKNSEPAGQPIVRSTKQRSQAEGEKNSQPSKVAPRTSSYPASRCSSRVVGEISLAAVAEPGEETRIQKKTDGRKGLSSAKNPPSQSGTKITSAPVMSQTVPRPARTTEVKRPKVPVRVVPQTEGKKLTAAQEERMRKLQAWREAKGISYKRPPMPVKAPVKRASSLPQPFWATMKEEDEVHSLIYAVERSLADCLKLLGEGCPTEQVKRVLSRLPPVSQKFAKYWICQARVMEREGNLDVLPVFEEAVRVVLEPVDELRTAVFEILKKKDEIQESENNEKEEEDSPQSNKNPVKTPPEPVRALIWGEKGHSSVVKYKITATPRGPASQQREPARVNGQELRFFTPVRRSVRIERASLRYPASLQDHDLCVASYNDLIAKEDEEKSEEQKDEGGSPSANNTLYVYRQNDALKDKVLVQLFCSEDGGP